MTPRTYKRKGKGVVISYTITNSSLGYLLLAATTKGICAVRLGNDKRKLERELKEEFAAAELKQNDRNLQKWIQALIDYLENGKSIREFLKDFPTVTHAQATGVLESLKKTLLSTRYARAA